MDSTNSVSRPFRLIPEFKDRIWGVSGLKEWFADAPARTIGEAWFTSEDNRTDCGRALRDLLLENPELLGAGRDGKHPGLCPLLVKLLFTSSRLSVQVHPKDDYAALYHQSLGKTEAWFVIDAKPEAEVALGFKQQISAEWFRNAAVSGEIENLLDWRPVEPGDTIFVPAGTVHAIGAGLTICEIQQNSDITYRLYDYGRPRELHLEHGCAVSDLGPYLHHFDRKELDAGRTLLAESAYFRIEHLRQKGNPIVLPGLPYYCLLVSLTGAGTIDGQHFSKAQVWMVPAHAGAVGLKSDDAEWLLTYTGIGAVPAVEMRS
ncbi:MAG: type I phosphomannose isomerase catalytic subunit [Bryobacteraceae bacterium]